MGRAFCLLLVCAVLLPLVVGAAAAPTGRKRNGTDPPFGLGLLSPVKDFPLHRPKNPYNIFVNYELGMHCVGFGRMVLWLWTTITKEEGYGTGRTAENS